MANKKITELTVTTTLTGTEVSEVVQGGVNKQITKSNEKTFYTTSLPDPTNPQDVATKAYADALVVGLWDDRGNFDASVNAYPSSGGSGSAGAIKKGDIWTISVAGVLPTGKAVTAGDTVRALIDTPANLQANWAIAENNIGYVPENQANKENTTLDTSTTKYPTNRLVKEYVDNATPANASETAKGIVEEATDAETTAGTSTGSTGAKLFVTPTKLLTWFATKIASETEKGIVEEATDAEVTAGTAVGATGAKLVVTPAKLLTWFSTKQATETAKGIAEIATMSEAKCGVDDTRIITPKKLREVLYSPPSEIFNFQNFT